MRTSEHNVHIEVPWAETITPYDEAHFVTYLRILDANHSGADLSEIAAVILGIDPLREPEKAIRAASSHLRRAQWMTTQGYRQLLVS